MWREGLKGGRWRIPMVIEGISSTQIAVNMDINPAMCHSVRRDRVLLIIMRSWVYNNNVYNHVNKPSKCSECVGVVTVLRACIFFFFNNQFTLTNDT